ncbi:MAG: hypothetical protein GXP14_17220 [Gammaproteobacteria bacterium]|nr:hypothetical protein [Gammaproteobacteria bacterium]
MVKFTQKMMTQKLLLIVLIALTAGANAHEKQPKEFVHGIAIKLHQGTYNFAGPPDGKDGATDVPGHSWLRIGKNRLLGKHMNTGPFGAPNYFSSDAGDGALLYAMEAVIDKWSEARSLLYYTKGFNHYHMLINVKTGERHPTKVVWFKHVAVKKFKLDGEGVLAFLRSRGEDATPRDIMLGVDYGTLPANWNIPYDPNPATAP